MKTLNKTTNSITKTISINCDHKKVYKFISDALNLPQWAIVNIKSVRHYKDDWYLLQTTFGESKFRFLLNEKLGILDHEFITPNATWNTAMRVIPNLDGAEIVMTFIKPTSLNEVDFSKAINSALDTELKTLKSILEKQ